MMIWVACLLWLQPASAQLLDRVVARVDSSVIMLSDLRAAVALGVVDQGADAAALDALIERQVMLAEVARFPAPEPADAAIEELAAMMKAHVGPNLQMMVKTTGIDEPRIRELARDTLRIRAYVRQRFGAAATLDAPDVRQWLRDARARATVVVTTSR